MIALRTCSLALCALLPFVIGGCTTTAAKKAMNKPQSDDSYAAFGQGAADASKRKAEKLETIKEDTDPEIAVSKLVDQMQHQELSHIVSAEEQLRVWGGQQGVDKIVYNKVRLLLKNPRMEVRAPALRLTRQFGGKEAVGDLIEALADSERGIRQEAFRSLEARTHRDFGYMPDGGEVARSRAVDDWRKWWQEQQRVSAVQPPSVYEDKRPSEPKIITPGQ
ncbi:MAG TPA: hypothetical protein VGP72_10185 [Planctomycetota bacterium]|jgi:hypothetical protein